MGVLAASQAGKDIEMESGTLGLKRRSWNCNGSTKWAERGEGGRGG